MHLREMQRLNLPRFAVLALAAICPLKGDELADLKAENARLRSLLREHAEGMSFPRIETRTGKIFRNVVLKEVEGESISFTYADGDVTLEKAEWPQECMSDGIRG